MSITTRTLLAGAAAAAVAALVTILAITSDGPRSYVHDHSRIERIEQLRDAGVPLP
uniref:Secreted protein n=1 Tax=Streptomyces sp. NBC_00003 TaxID=2903608 RepID=A0AAU2V7D5_9ACTN